MFRTTVLLVFALIVSPCLTGEGDALAAPNVILLMADDMGYECLGCNGSASYRTPHLDRLAASGLRFRHCYSQPLCTPSRVKIMTGKSNHQNYVEFGYLDPREKTFGHLMQDAGYKTCIAGKWQLNGLSYNFPDNQNTRRPIEAGFHESCLWQVTKSKPVGERYADPVVEINGEVRKLDDAYGPQVFADFVCDFIDRHADEPFFVYFPMVLTHDPFVPTPDSAEWNGGDRYRKDKKFFADMVAYADKIVGQIDTKVADAGIRENTILMFTADNGTQRGMKTLMTDGTTVVGGKGTTPNAGTHVPFVVSWPGTAPEGVVSNDLIDFSDFYLTLADIAGADILAEMKTLDGRSFLPQLKGETGDPRTFVFCHYDSRWGATAQYRNRYARNQVHKLYLDGQLYEITNDALELSPLQDLKPGSAADRDMLQQVLDALPPWNPQPVREKEMHPNALKLK